MMALSTKRIVILILSCFMLSSLAAGQENGKVDIDLDCSVFKKGENVGYLEIYYAVGQQSLSYSVEDGQEVANVMMHLKILKDDSLFSSKIWRLESVSQDSTGTVQTDKMVDQFRLEVTPGEYIVKMLVKDLNKDVNSDSVSMNVTVVDFGEDDSALSDLQLASSIQKAAEGKKDIFYKNTLNVYPNPGSLYGSELPVMFYYLETYNLDKSLTGTIYQTRAEILDDNEKIVDQIKPRIKKKQVAPITVEVGTIPVAALPTGMYNLKFSVLNEQDEEIRNVVKKFYIFNTDMERQISEAHSEQISAIFAGMTEDELDKEYDYVRYIIRPEETEMWGTLETVEGKKQFFTGFWARRDPDPQTTLNEMRERYYDRIEYADRNLKSLSRPGWKTDRGRVFIIYGAAEYIDRFPSTEQSYPHEVWHYDHIPRYGMVQFIFADFQGFEEYRMIHSTVTGEIQNPDWQNEILIR